MTERLTMTSVAKQNDEDLMRKHSNLLSKIEIAAVEYEEAVEAEKAAIALRTKLIGDAVHERGIPNRIILQACPSLTPMKVTRDLRRYEKKLGDTNE